MRLRKEACENDVVWNCCAWLNSNGFYAWRNQSVGVYDPKAKSFRRPAAFTISGVSDIIALRDGKTYFIECKFGRGSQSKEQKAFEAQCKRHNVDYVVVYSVNELCDCLEGYKDK
jgi:Holliday junction resolvase